MSADAKVELVPIFKLKPCPENSDIYGRLTTADPDVQELIKSILDRGVLEPIQISLDDYIISGHRRCFSATHAGLHVAPVIRRPIAYGADRDTFLKLLVVANTQRKKSAAMLMREAAMKIDSAQAYRELRQEQKDRERERRLESNVGEHMLDGKHLGDRAKISKAKDAFLEAALDAINALREYWPISLRTVHYRLLGPNAPLKHASKPKSVYVNDRNSYKSLSDLLTRARLEGNVPWESIDDETRPEELNNHYRNAGRFFEDELRDLLRGYQRNRQQSQPDHIEIVAEKLAVRGMLSPIAAEHSTPLSIVRGQNGPTVKRKIAKRFQRSGKRNLILLVVADLDPAGETIVQNFRDDLESDFGIHPDRLEVYRAGLNIGRVEEFDLAPSMEAKESSPTYDAFVEKYGITDAYELEAMTPEELQEALVEDINEVIDIDAYNSELEREEQDAVAIKAAKDSVLEFLKTIDLGDAR